MNKEEQYYPPPPLVINTFNSEYEVITKAA